MTDRYLPVPVWNNQLGRWEPIDFRHGQCVTAWPDGFDPTRLPLLDYRDGGSRAICAGRDIEFIAQNVLQALRALIAQCGPA